MAAAKLFELFDRRPVPDSSDPDGLQPVRTLHFRLRKKGGMGYVSKD